ncbi:hypothetical protein SK128_003128 [Halocaridina rubra]|uniref:Uncharacterized protein n=1 Tax=Halocaridina rubra TaxID=373956 RepID=A0AAN8W9X9_HALRR
MNSNSFFGRDDSNFHFPSGLPTPMRSPRGSPKTSPQASPAATPKQSPVTSPKTHHKQSASKGCAHRCVHGYLCGRISLLHISVVCVLLGITLLVVGLVQLAPGAAIVTDRGLPAGSSINKYAIIGAGTGFLGLGFLLLIILCACQKNTHRRRRHPAVIQPFEDENNINSQDFPELLNKKVCIVHIYALTDKYSGILVVLKAIYKHVEYEEY